MAEVRAGVPAGEAAGGQQLVVEPDGRRVVARRVAAGGDRGQEEQRGAEVVEEDEEDRGQAEAVGQHLAAAGDHGGSLTPGGVARIATVAIAVAVIGRGAAAYSPRMLPSRSSELQIDVAASRDARSDGALRRCRGRRHAGAAGRCRELASAPGRQRVPRTHRIPPPRYADAYPFSILLVSLSRRRRKSDSARDGTAGRAEDLVEAAVHQLQRLLQVAAAVLVVAGQLAHRPPVALLGGLLPQRERHREVAPALRPRGQAQQRGHAHRAGVARRPAAGSGPPTRRTSPRARGRRPGRARRAGPRRGRPRTHWQASTASAASEITSSRLCCSTRAMARPSRARGRNRSRCAGSPRRARRPRGESPAAPSPGPAAGTTPAAPSTAAARGAAGRSAAPSASG